MTTFNGSIPEPLRNAGATDFERRLLRAAVNEMPSAELTERMALALGVPAVALGAGANTTIGAGSAKAAGTAMLWTWIAGGGVILALAGAFLSSHFSGSRASAPPAPPAVLRAAPPEPPPSPAAEKTTAASLPPVAATSPSPRRRAVAGPADLAAQIAMLDTARSALASADYTRTLATLRRYQDRFPSGSFRPEATALTVEALFKAGRRVEARALAEKFMSEHEHEHSPLADRVARIVGLQRL
jgi:hypothetical protein